MGELAVIPGKFARFDQHTGNRGPMPTNELRRRMDDDIGSILKGAAQIRRCKRIVHNQRQARFMGNISHSPYIEHIAAWIANGLTIKDTCAWRDSFLVILWFRTINKDRI